MNKVYYVINKEITFERGKRVVSLKNYISIFTITENML